MKISEKLAVIKRQEGELMRAYELRDGIAKQSFKETMLLCGNETAKELEKSQKVFMEEKKRRVDDCNKRIEALKKEIVDGKNRVNRKNVEIGIDKKLVEIKFLRVELSRLMKLIKISDYSDSLNIDVFEKLGIASRIKELEEQKQKLDNEIQKTNWSTDI